jgi:hypothetical protein
MNVMNVIWFMLRVHRKKDGGPPSFFPIKQELYNRVIIMIN